MRGQQGKLQTTETTYDLTSDLKTLSTETTVADSICLLHAKMHSFLTADNMLCCPVGSFSHS